MNRAVLDASVALSWVLPGEDTSLTLPLRDLATSNKNFVLLAPPIFYFEAANALWVAQQRGRIKEGIAEASLEALLDFDIRVLAPDPLQCLELSCKYIITVYDSSYLAIALAQEAALWTVDRSLAAVAEKMEVTSKPDHME